MRKKTIVVAGAATLIAVGAFAGSSIAGGSSADQVVNARVKLLQPQTAVTNPDGTNSSVVAKPKHHSKKKPTIQYFYSNTFTVPPEGGGTVQALRCPKGKGEPIAGGAQTSIGIVVSYLSRIKPGSNGKTPARTYYVGVDDNSTTNDEGSGARVEIQCAKDIAVKHG